MGQSYDVIVPMTMDNLPVFKMNVEWMKRHLAYKRIIVIGAENLREPSAALGVDFIMEDDLVEGMTLKAVRECIERRLGHGKRAGWYFQQFLKLGYAYACNDEYYIVWDADTVPLHKIEHMIDGCPAFTKKEEMEPAYFQTLDVLFAGDVKKYGDFSFICENMIMNVMVMKEMLDMIMRQPNLQGNYFWERILNAVSDENLPGSGFSEFETYGNYVMRYYPKMYRLRTLRGLRNGAEFFGMSPNEGQLEWAARSYDTIAFERWSHHRGWLGKLCSNKLVQTLFPLAGIVKMKKMVSKLRSA